MMKSVDGGSAGRPEKRLTARSNDPHQALTGVRASAVGGSHGGEHQRRLCRGREVRGHLGGVVRRVLVVLVEACLPGRLLRREIELDRPDQLVDRRQHFAGDLGDSPVGRERDPVNATVAVLDERLVRAEIQRDHEGARAVRGGECEGLPAACGEPQRGVLELRLGRRERGSELAENLRVRVERVARWTPRLVGERRPVRSHRPTLPIGGHWSPSANATSST